MALLPITPQAGVFTDGTQYSSKGAWIDSNLIRFQTGILKNIGGWEKLRATALTGSPIGLFAYTTNSGDEVLVVGTREKVYVLYRTNWLDITPSGFVTPASTDPLGYGAYNYNVEDYGDARSQSGLSLLGDSYSFDNWGEYLLFCCSSDGKIYQWRPDAGSGSPDATGIVLSNAPTSCNAVVVSNERHVIAIGAGGDPRKIQWSSRENNNLWAAASTNTAGSLQVPMASRALAGVKHGTDILIFTDTGVGSLYFTGQPFVYGIRSVATNAKAISARAIVSAGSFVAWMGESSIFLYDGSVRELPCPVSTYIFDNINQVYRASSTAGHCSAFNEIWFFFPSGESQTPNKYVTWNYLENTWTVGTLSRGAYMDEGVFSHPIACDPDGYVFFHEKGNLFNSFGLGAAEPYATSGAIELGNGDNYIHAKQILPDSESNTLPGVTLSFDGKFTPLGETFNFGSFTFESDGYTDCRFSGRQVMLTVTGDTNQNWRLGNIRLDVQKQGRR